MNEFSDIGDQRLAGAALQKSEEKFSKGFRFSPAAMFIDGIDTDCFLDINEAFERISGYRPEEVVGRTLSELGLFSRFACLGRSTKTCSGGGELLQTGKSKS
jgi:PAS domain-containing protein